MTGKTFNNLQVIEQVGFYRSDPLWRCKCNCGKETIVYGYHLRSGHTKSCGNCSVYANEADHMKCTVASGRYFLFDHADYPIIKSGSWSVSNYGYVLGLVNGKKVKLHRYLMQASNGQVVDHINGLPWDCRRENLRVTTQMKNTYNQRIKKSNKTGYKGVCFDKRTKRYMAYIHPNRKFSFLGYYSDPKEAAIAYNKAAFIYFGEYACLNTI